MLFGLSSNLTCYTGQPEILLTTLLILKFSWLELEVSTAINSVDGVILNEFKSCDSDPHSTFISIVLETISSFVPYTVNTISISLLIKPKFDPCESIGILITLVIESIVIPSGSGSVFSLKEKYYGLVDNIQSELMLLKSNQLELSIP